MILRLRRAPPSWILYKRNLSREIVKKLQNYSFKWGKNNKFCSRLDTVIDLFSSHLMYESIFKRLVCTPPDLSPKFTCKVNLTNQKIRPNYYILAFLLDRGMQRVNWLKPRTIVCCLKLSFVAAQISIVSPTEYLPNGETDYELTL